MQQLGIPLDEAWGMDAYRQPEREANSTPIRRVAAEGLSVEDLRLALAKLYVARGTGGIRSVLPPGFRCDKHTARRESFRLPDLSGVDPDLLILIALGFLLAIVLKI